VNYLARPLKLRNDVARLGDGRHACIICHPDCCASPINRQCKKYLHAARQRSTMRAAPSYRSAPSVRTYAQMSGLEGAEQWRASVCQMTD